MKGDVAHPSGLLHSLFISSAALEDPKLQLGPYELCELLGEEKIRVTRTANAPYVLLLVNSCLLIAINYQVIPAK